MIFALFFLFNLILVTAFLYVLYRAIILVRKEIGIWAAVILVLGVVPKGSNSSKNEIKKFEFNADKVIANRHLESHHLILEDNLLNDIHIDINYGFDEKSQQYIPTEATSYVTGITTSNHQWTPQIVIINPTNNPKRFTYEVHGSILWKIFAISTYNESKVFTGFINIK